LFYNNISNFVGKKDYIALKGKVYGLPHIQGLISLNMGYTGNLMPEVRNTAGLCLSSGTYAVFVTSVR
jgi:hypothetical protein